MERRSDTLDGTRWLPWLPLVAGALNSYGPVGWNYGFALYFLSYRHGFVKRGLLGTVVEPLGLLSRTRLLTLEYLFLAAAFLLTYVVFRPVLFGNGRAVRLAAFLLAGPAVLPHLGYLFAQPDVLLYLLLLCAVWILLRLPPRIAAALSLPVCALALLAHEAFALMFYPLVLALLLDLCRRKRLPWAVAAAHLAAMLAVFAAVLHFGKLKVDPAVILREAQQRTDVGVQPQVYQVMASSLSQQEKLVRLLYSRRVIEVLLLTLVLLLPLYATLGKLVLRALRASGAPRWQMVLTLVLMLAPLPLCALGHDTTRWIGAVGIDTSLLLLCLYLWDRPAGPVRTVLEQWAGEPRYLPWLGYALLLGPMGATGLRLANEMVSAWTGP